MDITFGFLRADAARVGDLLKSSQHAAAKQSYVFGSDGATEVLNSTFVFGIGG